MDGSLSRKVMRVLDDNGRLVESRDEQYGDGERLVKLKHKVGDWQLEEEYSESGELIARREQDAVLALLDTPEYREERALDARVQAFYRQARGG